MSHITSQKVEIKNANEQLVREAIDLMIRNIPELQRVDHIEDYYHKRMAVKNGIGIKHDRSQYGQIVSVKDGEITITGENMDSQTRRYLEHQLKQFYNARTTMRFMEREGFSYQMAYQNGKVKIRGQSR